MITLKTLPQATAQQVFDQVATHLLTQNAKSYDESLEACVYKGPNNLSCAAGCLIANDEYNINFEEKGWGTLIEDYYVPATHQYLITELQILHDQKCVEEWPETLWKVAMQYELNADVVV
jgi:hypothetical protein